MQLRPVAPVLPASRLSVKVARALLFVGGVGLTVWLIQRAGPALVLSAMEQAGPWLPLIVLLEACILFTDVVAVRCLLGARSAAKVTGRGWVRSATLAYASSIVLPAGRAAGEAIRAANLAPAVGIVHATGVCTRIQGGALLGNAACSFALGAALLPSDVPRLLPYALLLNALLCVTIGGTVMLVAQSRRVAAWVRSRFPRMGESGRPHVEIPAAAVRRAVFSACVGRVIQTLQYGFVVQAVAGGSSPWKAAVAQGIHLVGATVGDLVPNQAGAMEATYQVFLGALGLAGQPQRALAIALIIRVAQLGLSGLCFAVGASVMQPHESSGEPTAVSHES